MEYYLDRKICLVAFFAMITVGISVTTAQRVDVNPEKVIVRVGDRTSMTCRISQPLLFCRFEIPGEPNAFILSQDWNTTSGFSYYGSGLNVGQCGITIDRVKASNHGPSRCYLGTQGTEFNGQIDIIVALAPLAPEIDVETKSPRPGQFEVDQEIRVSCISRDGRPPANITWFLDDEPILTGLMAPEIYETRDNQDTSVFTATQTLQRFIRPTDDRRSLICRANHFAYESGFQDTRLQLTVRYRPQPLPVTKVYGLILGSSAAINITIRANPRPKTQWIFDGVSIPEGTQNGRYAAYEAVDLGRGDFNVTLVISSLTLEDTTKDYMLRASNEFGTQDYIIRISSSDVISAEGLDVGSIIGIVIGILVLIIIITLIVVARATGRWCFAESHITKPSETQNEPEARTSFVSRLIPTTWMPSKSSNTRAAIEDTDGGSSLPSPSSPLSSSSQRQQSFIQFSPSISPSLLSGNDGGSSIGRGGDDIDYGYKRRANINEVGVPLHGLTNQSEKSDTESVETKPQPKKLFKPKLSLNAIFKKKNKDNVEEGAPEGGEGGYQQHHNENDDHTEDGNPRDSEETVVITDEVITPPSKQQQQVEGKNKDGNIVYAELMLKPSVDTKKPTKTSPSTEYAEIVHVTTPQQNSQT